MVLYVIRQQSFYGTIVDLNIRREECKDSALPPDA